MNSDIKTPTEPLEKKLKADCNSCMGIKVEFSYVGFNRMILDSGIGDALIQKYGKNALFLYGCDLCSTSMTLASLKPYPQ